MNINMTINKHNYGTQGATQAWGIGYFASYTIDGVDADYKAGGGFRLTLVDVIDDALKNVINSLGFAGNTADITINLPEGVTLSETLKTFIVDKFELEDEITSITFE